MANTDLDQEILAMAEPAQSASPAPSLDQEIASLAEPVAQLAAPVDAQAADSDRQAADYQRQDKLVGAPLGSKGWRDAFHDSARGLTWLPYLNVVELGDSVRAYKLASRVKNGTATEKESDELNGVLLEQQRGTSFGYKFWDATLRLPAFAIEVATTGGILKGIGKMMLLRGGEAAAMAVGKAALKTGLRTGEEAAIRAGTRGIVDAGLTVGAKVDAAAMGEQIAGKVVTEVPIAGHLGTWQSLATAVKERAGVLPMYNMLESTEAGADVAFKKGLTRVAADAINAADLSTEEGVAAAKKATEDAVQGYASGFLSKATVKEAGLEAPMTALRRAAQAGADIDRIATQQVGRLGVLPERLGSWVGKALPSSETVGTSFAKFLAETGDEGVSELGGTWLASQAALREVKAAAAAGTATEFAVGETAKMVAEAGKRTAEAVGKSALLSVPRGALRTALPVFGSGHLIANEMVRLMTPMYGLEPDQQGELHRILTAEGDDFGEAAAKAFGDSWVNNASVDWANSLTLLRGLFGATGAATMMKGAVLSSTIGKAIADNDGLTQAGKVIGDLTFGVAGKPGLIKQMGWNGWAGGMFMVYAGQGVKMATGIQPVQPLDPEEVAATALSFAFNPMMIGTYAMDKRRQATMKLVDDFESHMRPVLDAQLKAGVTSMESVKPLLNDLSNIVDGYHGIQTDTAKLGPIQKMVNWIMDLAVTRPATASIEQMYYNWTVKNGQHLQALSAMEPVATPEYRNEVFQTFLENSFGIQMTRTEAEKAAVESARLHTPMAESVEQLTRRIVLDPEKASLEDVQQALRMNPRLGVIVKSAGEHAASPLARIGRNSELVKEKWESLNAGQQRMWSLMSTDKMAFSEKLGEGRKYYMMLQELSRLMPEGFEVDVHGTHFITGTDQEFRDAGQPGLSAEQKTRALLRDKDGAPMLRNGNPLYLRDMNAAVLKNGNGIAVRAGAPLHAFFEDWLHTAINHESSKGTPETNLRYKTVVADFATKLQTVLDNLPPELDTNPNVLRLRHMLTGSLERGKGEVTQKSQEEVFTKSVKVYRGGFTRKTRGLDEFDSFLDPSDPVIRMIFEGGTRKNEAGKEEKVGGLFTSAEGEGKDRFHAFDAGLNELVGPTGLLGLMDFLKHTNEPHLWDTEYGRHVAVDEKAAAETLAKAKPPEHDNKGETRLAAMLKAEISKAKKIPEEEPYTLHLDAGVRFAEEHHGKPDYDALLGAREKTILETKDAGDAKKQAELFRRGADLVAADREATRKEQEALKKREQPAEGKLGRPVLGWDRVFSTKEEQDSAKEGERLGKESWKADPLTAQEKGDDLAAAIQDPKLRAAFQEGLRAAERAHDDRQAELREKEQTAAVAKAAAAPSGTAAATPARKTAATPAATPRTAAEENLSKADKIKAELVEIEKDLTKAAAIKKKAIAEKDADARGKLFNIYKNIATDELMRKYTGKKTAWKNLTGKEWGSESLKGALRGRAKPKGGEGKTPAKQTPPAKAKEPSPAVSETPAAKGKPARKRTKKPSEAERIVAQRTPEEQAVDLQRAAELDAAVRAAEAAQEAGAAGQVPPAQGASKLGQQAGAAKQAKPAGEPPAAYSLREFGYRQPEEPRDSYGFRPEEWTDESGRGLPGGKVYRGLSRRRVEKDADGNLILRGTRDDLFSRRLGEAQGVSVTDDSATARDYAVGHWNAISETEALESRDRTEGDIPTVVAIDPAAWQEALRTAVAVRGGQESVDPALLGEQRVELAKGASLVIPKGSFSAHELKGAFSEEEGSSGFFPLHDFSVTGELLRRMALARGPAIALARELGIQNPREYVDLLQQVAYAEKEGAEKTLDPITGRTMSAPELMAQLQAEGKPSMGDEFSKRRGYTPEEISNWRLSGDLQQKAIEAGVAAEDAQQLMGIATGQLSVPQSPAAYSLRDIADQTPFRKILWNELSKQEDLKNTDPESSYRTRAEWVARLSTLAAAEPDKARKKAIEDFIHDITLYRPPRVVGQQPLPEEKAEKAPPVKNLDDDSLRSGFNATVLPKDFTLNPESDGPDPEIGTGAPKDRDSVLNKAEASNARDENTVSVSGDNYIADLKGLTKVRAILQALDGYRRGGQVPADYGERTALLETRFSRLADGTRDYSGSPFMQSLVSDEAFDAWRNDYPEQAPDYAGLDSQATRQYDLKTIYRSKQQEPAKDEHEAKLLASSLPYPSRVSQNAIGAWQYEKRTYNRQDALAFANVMTNQRKLQILQFHLDRDPQTGEVTYGVHQVDRARRSADMADIAGKHIDGLQGMEERETPGLTTGRLEDAILHFLQREETDPKFYPDDDRPNLTRPEFLHALLGIDLETLNDLETTEGGRQILDKIVSPNGMKIDDNGVPVSQFPGGGYFASAGGLQRFYKSEMKPDDIERLRQDLREYFLASGVNRPKAGPPQKIGSRITQMANRLSIGNAYLAPKYKSVDNKNRISYEGSSPLVDDLESRGVPIIRIDGAYSKLGDRAGYNATAGKMPIGDVDRMMTYLMSMPFDLPLTNLDRTPMLDAQGNPIIQRSHWAIVDQFADKDQIYVIAMPHHTPEEALNMYRAEWDQASEGTRVFMDDPAELDKLTPEQGRDYRLMTALDRALILPSLFGNLEAYADYVKEVKRAGTKITPGIVGLSSLMDKFSHHMVFNSSVLRTAGFTPADVKVLDGMAFNVRAWRQSQLQPALGEVLARTGLDGEFPNGMTSVKALIDYLDPDALTRLLVKGNFHDIELFDPKVSPQFAGSVYAKLLDYVTRYNEQAKKDGRPTIDHFSVRDTAKVVPGNKVVDLLDTHTVDGKKDIAVTGPDGKIQARPVDVSMPTVENGMLIPVRNDRYYVVQELRHATEPADAKIPKQVAGISMSLPSSTRMQEYAEFIQKISEHQNREIINSKIYGDDEAARTEFFRELLNPTTNPDLWASLVEPPLGGKLVNPKNDAVVQARLGPILASWLASAVLDHRGKRLVMQEVGAADNAIRGRMARREGINGEWDDVPVGVALTPDHRIAAASADLNAEWSKNKAIRYQQTVSRETLRQLYPDEKTADGKPVYDIDRLERYMMDGRSTVGGHRPGIEDYTDLREIDADGNPTINWQRHEIQGSKDNLIIPGELLMVARVPVTNLNSITAMRARHPILGAGNLIMTDALTQYLAGSDNDGDQRFLEVFSRKSDGKLHTTGAAGARNRWLALMNRDYSDSSLHPRIMTGINIDMFKDIIKPYADAEQKFKATNPDAYLQARRRNLVGGAMRGLFLNQTLEYDFLRKYGAFLPAVGELGRINGRAMQYMSRDGSVVKHLVVSRNPMEAGTEDLGGTMKSVHETLANMALDSTAMGEFGIEGLGGNSVTGAWIPTLMITDPVLSQRAQEKAPYTVEDARKRMTDVAEFLHSPQITNYVRDEEARRGLLTRGTPRKDATRITEDIKFMMGMVQEHLDIVSRFINTGFDIPASARETLDAVAFYNKVMGNKLQYFDMSGMQKNGVRRPHQVEGELNAVREPGAAQEVPQSAGGRENLGEGGSGMGQGVGGVAPAGTPQEAAFDRAGAAADGSKAAEGQPPAARPGDAGAQGQSVSKLAAAAKPAQVLPRMTPRTSNINDAWQSTATPTVLRTGSKLGQVGSKLGQVARAAAPRQETRAGEQAPKQTIEQVMAEHKTLPEKVLVTGPRTSDVNPPAHGKPNWSEDTEHVRNTKAFLETQLREAVAKGAKEFTIGTNPGVDLWAGEIIAKMKSEGIPVKLRIALPTAGYLEDPTLPWKDESGIRQRFLAVKAAADSLYDASHGAPKYQKEHSEDRDTWMAKDAGYVLAVAPSGGRAQGTRDTVAAEEAKNPSGVALNQAEPQPYILPIQRSLNMAMELHKHSPEFTPTYKAIMREVMTRRAVNTRGYPYSTERQFLVPAEGKKIDAAILRILIQRGWEKATGLVPMAPRDLDQALSDRVSTMLRQPEFAGNPFLEHLQPTIRWIRSRTGRAEEQETVELLGAEHGADFTQGQLERSWDGFDALPEQAKDEITYLALQRHGANDTTWNGGYLQLISPEYRGKISDAVGAELERWRTGNEVRRNDIREIANDIKRDVFADDRETLDDPGHYSGGGYSLREIQPVDPDRDLDPTYGSHGLRELQVRLYDTMSRMIHSGRVVADQIDRLSGKSKGSPYYYAPSPDKAKWNVWDPNRGTAEHAGEVLASFDTVEEARAKTVELNSARAKPSKEQQDFSDMVQAAATSFIEHQDYARPVWRGEVSRDEKGDKITVPTAGEGWRYELADYNATVGQVRAKLGEKKFDEIVALTRQAYANGRSVVNYFMSGLIDRDEYIRNHPNYTFHDYRLNNPDDPDAKARLEGFRQMRQYREKSGRTEGREYETYESAAAHRGLEPVSIRIGDQIRKWYDDVWQTATSQAQMVKGSLSKDMSGKPLWIPLFLQDQKEIERRAKEEKHGEFTAGMNDSAVMEMVENLRQSINWHISTKQGGFLADHVKVETGDPRKMLNSLTTIYKTELENMGYELLRKEPGRYKTIDNWLVLRYPDRANDLAAKRKPVKDDLPRNYLLMLENHQWDQNWMKQVQNINMWMKQGGLGLSLFHPFTLLETAMSFAGMDKGGLEFMNPFKIGGKYRDIQNAYNRALTDPDYGGRWIGAGLRVELTESPEYQSSKIRQQLKARLEGPMGQIPGLKHGLKGVDAYVEFVDKYLWQRMLPAMKVWAAEGALQRYREQFQQRKGRPLEDWEETRAMTDIADYVNEGFGGINWNHYDWATPKAKQTLRLGLLAPDWTFAATSIAGAGHAPFLGKIWGRTPGAIQTEQSLTRYWPSMILLTMTALPAAMQAAMYAAFGDPEKGDRPLPAMNEEGKGGLAGIGAHIDVTPLARMMGWEGGTSGRRRVYTRWAKQSTEVFEGWLTKPWETFAGKTSPSVKLAWEQLFGTTTSGYAMDFKDQGLEGVLFGKDKGIWGGRVAETAKMFLPMSITTLAEGRPSNFVAPMSQGMSLGKAQDLMAEVLQTYADQASWDEIKKNGVAKKNLAALAPELLRSAEANGWNPEQVMSGARRLVLTKLYREYFDLLNHGKLDAMHDVAKNIVRVNGTVADAYRAMKFRAKSREETLTPEQAAAIRESFQ